MRYHKYVNYSGKLIAIGTGNGGTEITKEEYEALLVEIRAKASFVDQLYNEEITLSDVPTEWQDEIQRRVNERIEADGTLDEQEISTEEFYNMVEEVL